jgi:large subunit ribosomal protein L4
VHVVSDLVAGETPSTKGALAALTAVASSDKVLVVLHRDDDLAWISLRNVPTVHVIAVDQLNAYDVLVTDEVVFTRTALDAFVAGPVSGRSAKGAARASEAGAELAATAAEDSTAPSDAELAATAASVAAVLEPTVDVTEAEEDAQ